MGGVLSMGGYGAYIWPAYAVTLAALGGLLLWSLYARGRIRRALRERGLDRRSREPG